MNTELDITPISTDRIVGKACLQGHIYNSYPEVVAVLGEPTDVEPSIDRKVDVRWTFEIDGIGAVSIWNFKNGPAYREKLYMWAKDQASKTIEGIQSFNFWAENYNAARFYLRQAGLDIN